MYGRFIWVLVLTVLMSQSAVARLKHIRFRTVPAATEAFIAIGPQNGKDPGLTPNSDGTFIIDDALFGERAAEVPVLLVAPGHELWTSFPSSVIAFSDAPVFPEQGVPELRMRGTTRLERVMDFFRYDPLRWGVYALLLATGLAVPVGLRSRGVARQAVQARVEAEAKAADSSELRFEGKVLGGYTVGRRLGAGGMGFVHEALPEDKNVPHPGKVAIKLILMTEDEETVQRARREIQTMVALTHPNIIRLFSEGETPVLFYIVMELLSGGTLEDRIKPGGMPVREVLETMRAIVQAVSYAHQRGFIHRDLKPGNVMFTATGQVKVMDFGLARKEKVSSKITRTGSILGTPAYISPEQVRGDVITPAVDQYSLGVMLYEMLVGALPFDGDPMDLLMRHLNDDPPAPRQSRPDLPEAIDRVVLRMMAKDPAQRFDTLETALTALEHALSTP